MAKTLDLSELPDVFRGSEARKAGLITPGQLRGHGVRRLFQDVYTKADIEVTHELRCRGAALIVPDEAVLTGRSAATVLGIELAQPLDPVEFVVPEKFRFGPIVGIKVRRTDVLAEESRPWQNAKIATPARIALDLLLRLSPRTRGWIRRLRIGVPDLDAFLRAGLVGELPLRLMFAEKRLRGIRLARHALQLSDRRAESLPESELRIVMVAGGFRPKPQYKVYKKRKFLGRLDLAIKECRVGVEYDGRWHETAEQRRLDHKRRQRMEAEGWRFVIVTAEQLATDYRGILNRIDDAVRAQLAR